MNLRPGVLNMLTYSAPVDYECCIFLPVFGVCVFKRAHDSGKK